MLEVRLLGAVGLRVDGVDVAVTSDRQLTLLARLALAECRLVPIERLIDDIWGDRPPVSAVNTVQVMVSSLRKLAGAGGIRTSGRAYGLNEGAVVDISAFRDEIRSGLAAAHDGDGVAAAAWLGRALARWVGTPFAGLDGAEFIDVERGSLTDLYLAGVNAYAGIRIRQGQAPAVVTELGQLISLHPYHEGLRAQLMMALAVCGRQVEALDAYERARNELAATFGIDPGTELRAAHEAVLRGDLPSAATIVRSRLRLGLLEVPGRLIGRERELSAVSAMCADPAVRLVTVLGTGGVGKTRLSQELVARATGDASFVSLLAAERAQDVAGTICESWGISLAGGPAEAAVAKAIADHSEDLLLVLDNFEHVLDAAKLVDSLLRDAPGLTVVVTSRTPLGLRAEHRITLDPLPTAGKDGTLSDASALLLDRVRRIDADFWPTDQDLLLAADIAKLCDGLPLAIEIAAARTTVLDLAELHRRLEHPLAALVAPGPAADRWSSVRASIAWSVNALPVSAAATLTAATVFRGGFTAAALAAVADLDLDTVADHLHRLVEHSLIRRETASGRRRFDLLQVVREFAAEPLGQAERLTLQDRHAEFFRSFLGPQPNFRNFPGTQAELDLIAGERPNLRAAIRHASRSHTDLLADLVVSVVGPWSILGLADELRGWLDHTLARTDLEEGRRVDCLMGLVKLDLGAGVTSETLARVWSLPAATVDPHRREWLIYGTAVSAVLRGELAEASKLLDDSRDSAEQLNDPLLMCYRLDLSGLGQYLDDRVDDAVQTFTRAWRMANDHGLDRAALMFGHDLGEALLAQGSAEEAAEVCMRSIAISHPEDFHRAAALSNYGAALALLGRPDEAESALRSSLALFSKSGWTFDGLDALQRLAAMYSLAQRHDQRAAFLFGVWSAGCADLGIARQPLAERFVDQFLTYERDAGDDSPVGRARANGRARVQTIGAAKAFDLTAAEELAHPQSASLTPIPIAQGVAY